LEEERRYCLIEAMNKRSEVRLQLGPQHGYLRLVDVVGHLFDPFAEAPLDSALLNSVARSLYQFCYAVNKSTALIESPLARLPGIYADEIVQSINFVAPPEGDHREWASNPPWIAELLTEFYPKIGFSRQSKTKAHLMIQNLLSMPRLDKRLVPRLLGFFQTQLQGDSDGLKDLCDVLIHILEHSLAGGNLDRRDVLLHFVSLGAFIDMSKAVRTVNNYDTTHSLRALLDTWGKDLMEGNHEQSERDAYQYVDSNFPLHTV
jgi:hypothetical protein